MAKRKKRNNLVCKRANYYYRLMVWTGTRQKEITIRLKTKNKAEALRRGKIVSDNADNIKDGTIQRFQFPDYFPWMNDKGISVLIEQTLGNIMPEYLAYKESKGRFGTANRDRTSLNQLIKFVGNSKPISKLNYLDIEGANGLIQHLRNKEIGVDDNGNPKTYSDCGINITLRHLRAFFNWLHKKAKLINEPIRFDLLPENEREYFIDEYQIQAIHDYINNEQNEIDSFFKRCYIFYELTGVRAIEPFVGELYGDWLYIDASKSKGKNLRKIQLSAELKVVLLEMQAFRDEYKLNGSSEPNVRAYERISKTLKKIVRALNFNPNRKITLKSFRHTYGIRRVYITGNIFQVSIEMGHKNVTTTQLYLRFQPDEIKYHFPNLKSIIESMENISKNGTMGTKTMGTPRHLVAKS
jgi:integrase